MSSNRADGPETRGVLSRNQDTPLDAARESSTGAIARLWRGAPVTKSLLGANVAAFLLVEAGEQFWPGFGRLFTNWGPFTLNGQWWRLLTSTFVHSSPIHLVVNLVFLWVLGKRAELIFGRSTFLKLYIACALTGGLTALALEPESIVCGASGAILGIAGALIAVYAPRVHAISARARWKLALLLLFAIFSVYPDAGGAQVDYPSHISGLLAGTCLGSILTFDFAQAREGKRRVFIAVAALLLVSGGVIRYRDGYVRSLTPLILAMDEGRANQALDKAERILQTHPDSVIANITASEAHLSNGDSPGAEAAARRALTSDPQSGFADLAISLIATAELREGRCEEARFLRRQSSGEVKYYQAAPPSLPGCNWTAAGDRYLLDGEADQAIDAYSTAVRLQPDDYQALLGLAKAYESKGLRKEAAEASAQAAAIQRRKH